MMQEAKIISKTRELPKSLFLLIFLIRKILFTLYNLRKVFTMYLLKSGIGMVWLIYSLIQIITRILVQKQNLYLQEPMRVNLFFRVNLLIIRTHHFVG